METACNVSSFNGQRGDAVLSFAGVGGWGRSPFTLFTAYPARASDGGHDGVPMGIQAGTILNNLSPCHLFPLSTPITGACRRKVVSQEL